MINYFKEKRKRAFTKQNQGCKQQKKDIRERNEGYKGAI